jgi:O-succinylbenzoic acid--CoA ligase
MYNNHKKIHNDFRLNGIEFTSIKSILLYTKENETDAYHFLKDWFNDTNFIRVKTSGSTGKPKQLKILKKHMINSAIATGKYFSLKEKTIALLCLSPNYIAGKMMLVRALVLGWALDIVAPKSNPLKGNKKYHFSAMVPLQVQVSLENLNNIDQLIIGGGAVSNSLLEKLQPLKTKIFATYGMTETVTHIAVKKLNHCKTNNYFEVLPKIKINQDERNCLVIKAPKITSKTIITNDIVKIINDKNFKWLGRYDNIINSGGIKIMPEQVENKLTKIIKMPFFVSSFSDDILGEKLVLIIEGKESPDLKSGIKNLDTLTKYEKPKTIFYLNKFVRTTTGKIDRNKTKVSL